MGYREKRLSNGLFLVEEDVPGARTFSLGLAFAAGSRHEKTNEHGAAHLLEHLAFRGGRLFPSEEAIDWRTEELGARFDAYTEVDHICFHAAASAPRLKEVAELVCDVALQPRLRTRDLEIERGVVMQEIALHEDNPEERIFTALERAIFGRHPLGRSVLGTRKSIKELTHQDLSNFRRRAWRPEGAICALAGHISADGRTHLIQLLERWPSANGGAAPSPVPPPKPRRRVLVENEDTKQTQLALSWTLPIESGQSLQALIALYTFTHILGGGMGSRLGRELRSRRALCYSVEASVELLSDRVGLRIMSDLDSRRIEEAYSLILRTVHSLAARGPTEAETMRAKASLLGECERDLEQSTERAFRIIHDFFIFGRTFSARDELRVIERITRADVRNTASIVHGLPSVACIGPHERGSFG